MKVGEFFDDYISSLVVTLYVKNKFAKHISLP